MKVDKGYLSLRSAFKFSGLVSATLHIDWSPTYQMHPIFPWSDLPPCQMGSAIEDGAIHVRNNNWKAMIWFSIFFVALASNFVWLNTSMKVSENPLQNARLSLQSHMDWTHSQRHAWFQKNLRLGSGSLTPTLTARPALDVHSCIRSPGFTILGCTRWKLYFEPERTNATHIARKIGSRTEQNILTVGFPAALCPPAIIW